jgi:aflatoxin B1 aldehyde reductase
VPFKETAGAINKLYKEGFIKHFGLSNFSAAQVEEMIKICKEHSYVLPSVFQGSYSAVVRKIEADLFPILRKNNIAFFAYSPIAGGFLTKSSSQFRNNSLEGRWNLDDPLGSAYVPMFNKPTLLSALDKWDEISEKSGVPKAELAFRWIAYHSYLKPEHGDGIIIGASKVEQAKNTLEALKRGPLERSIVEEIEAVWKIVEHEAPIDNYTSLQEQKTKGTKI